MAADAFFFFFINSVQHLLMFGGWTDKYHSSLATSLRVTLVRHVCLSAGLCVSQTQLVSHCTTATRISCQMSVPAAHNNSLQQPTGLLQRCELTKEPPYSYTEHIHLILKYMCIYISICTYRRMSTAWSLQCMAERGTSTA